MKREELKADLALLKRFVKEVEDGLEEAYRIRDNSDPNDAKKSYQDFLMKLYNIVGLLTGLSNEAGLLVGDLQKISQYSDPKAKAANDAVSLLKDMLAPPKSGRGEN